MIFLSLAVWDGSKVDFFRLQVNNVKWKTCTNLFMASNEVVFLSRRVFDNFVVCQFVDGEIYFETNVFCVIVCFIMHLWRNVFIHMDGKCEKISVCIFVPLTTSITTSIEEEDNENNFVCWIVFFSYLLFFIFLF
jgi:hypothetical protein